MEKSTIHFSLDKKETDSNSPQKHYKRRTKASDYKKKEINQKKAITKPDKLHGSISKLYFIKEQLLI